MNKRKNKTLKDTMMDLFPNGHPEFVPALLAQMQLHNDKNFDYARGGNPLGNFVRVANILKQWPEFPFDTPAGVAFIYALKQLDAEAWTMCQGGECKVEGLEGRTIDQAVYATLRHCLRVERDSVNADRAAELGG